MNQQNRKQEEQPMPRGQSGKKKQGWLETVRANEDKRKRSERAIPLERGIRLLKEFIEKRKTGSLLFRIKKGQITQAIDQDYEDVGDVEICKREELE